jgi:hypothetical protein
MLTDGAMPTGSATSCSLAAGVVECLSGDDQDYPREPQAPEVGAPPHPTSDGQARYRADNYGHSRAGNKLAIPLAQHKRITRTVLSIGYLRDLVALGQQSVGLAQLADDLLIESVASSLHRALLFIGPIGVSIRWTSPGVQVRLLA